MPLPFATIGIFLAALYFIAVQKAIQIRSVNRKCYMLLLNKTVGDIICCISSLGTSGYCLIVEHPKYVVFTDISNF